MNERHDEIRPEPTAETNAECTSDEVTGTGASTAGASSVGTSPSGITRREFVATSAALAAGAAIPTLGLSTSALASRAPVHAGGSDVIRVGLVGCGGRGTGAASQALHADEGARLVAVADVFEERAKSSVDRLSKIEAIGSRVDVPEERRFIGFHGYRDLLENVDVVLLATPPAFRPAHLAAAVESGKHIFCEKPMAVDSPGVRSVMESARLAKEKGLSLVSGFCWRYSSPERATFERILEGGLGDVHSVYTNYNTGTLGQRPRQAGWSDMEWQMRNWWHFRWLSGDHIVEQACHSVDKLSWAFGNGAPERAYAVGGRQARRGEESGNVYDHFSVTFEYPNGAKGFHMCRQIAGCSNENMDYVYGTKGVCEINGWGPRHVMTGEAKWRFKGDKNDMYQQEHDELFASIRSGQPVWDGDYMATSTLMSIMGRMAAYTGRTVTWDEALNSQEDLGLGIDLALGDVPIDPIAVPGVTPFA